jgi:hypothetical protein
VKPSVPCRRFAACKRSLHLPCKSHTIGKIGSAISCPYFLPSLIEVSHVAGRGAPLEVTGESKSGAQRAHSYGLGASGPQGPRSAPYSTLYSLASCALSIHQKECRKSLGCALSIKKYGNLSKQIYVLQKKWQKFGNE